MEIEFDLQMLLVIEASKEDYALSPEFEALSSLLTPINWDMGKEQETYYLPVYKATFKLINNQFSFDFDRAEKTSGTLPYKRYLTTNEIQSINYFQYGEEKIYRLMELDEDWYKVRSNDLFLVCTSLHQYLSQHTLTANHDEVAGDLKRMISLSAFCQSKDIHFAFFDSDW